MSDENLKLVKWSKDGYPPIDLNENVRHVVSLVKRISDLEKENEELKAGQDELAIGFSEWISNQGLWVSNQGLKLLYAGTTAKILELYKQSLTEQK